MVNRDPHSTQAELGRAYWANHARIMARVSKEVLGWLSIDVLEGIEATAKAKPESKISHLNTDMLQMLQSADFSVEDQRAQFKSKYDEADALAHPAASAYVRHSEQLKSWTMNHSLSIVDLHVLRNIDLLGHTDPTYGKFSTEMSAKIGSNISAPNVVRYNQFFEVYCEAMTLRYLRGREGIKAERVEEAAEEQEKRPDFRCVMDDGSEFYIEVKALDIVGGNFRHDQIMVDAIDQKVDLDRQVRAGKTVALAEGEIAPYRQFDEHETYDPRSQIRVIETLQQKFFQAFKPGQFALGPTFATAVVDRLIIHGNHCALAPYYFDDLDGGCCLSGAIWQATFGVEGSPVFRHPDFIGMPSLEGHLKQPGYFVDAGRPFPGVGLIVLTKDGDERLAYGLAADHAAVGSWTADVTSNALNLLCCAYNDGKNSNASSVSFFGRKP